MSGSDRRLIAAHTGPASPYPGYVNVSEEPDGTIAVTVRSDRKPDGSCGDIAVTRMTRDELILLMAVGLKGA